MRILHLRAVKMTKWKKKKEKKSHVFLDSESTIKITTHVYLFILY